MTWVHGLQIVVAAGVVPVVVERVRTLFYRAPIEARSFLRVLSERIQGGDLEGARAVVAAGEPAWLARLGRAVLEARGQGDDVEAALEELELELRYEAAKGMHALRILGRLALALGLLGAVVELMWMLQGDHGLTGLQAGRVERIASARVLLSLVLAVGVTLFCGWFFRLCQHQAGRLRRETRRGVQTLVADLTDG